MNDIYRCIKSYSSVPSKHVQIVSGILDAIESDLFKKHDRLPSVNRFIQRLGYSRMTIVRALNELKERGIIESENKVGYFVRDENTRRKFKVFLMLAGLNAHHEILYNSLIDALAGRQIEVDLYFHHFNPHVFRALLREYQGVYGLYAVSGFDHPMVIDELQRIAENRLLQIIRPPVVDGSFLSQCFGDGLMQALNQLAERLKRYDRFVLVFSDEGVHPKEIKHTFCEFCRQQHLAYSVEPQVDLRLLRPGTAFWVIEDRDLLSLIKEGEAVGLRLGVDLGVLSYNETMMKEIVRQGITVVSVDFAALGRSIADYLIRKEPKGEFFAPYVILRKSL